MSTLKISRRPKSISAVHTHFTHRGRLLQVMSGPSSLSGSPTLLIQLSEMMAELVTSVPMAIIRAIVPKMAIM